MRIATLAFTLASASIFAQQPVPYDADLFHKDLEVYSVNSEFLYWTVQEAAIDYAEKMNQPADPSSAYASGSVKSATFDLDPGFRVNVGYYNAPKTYEVRGQYTHLIASGKDRASAPTAPLYLTGTWPQLLEAPLVHAHSSIALNYNVFDVMVNRLFLTNLHFRLRLSVAISSAWIHQYWNIHYFRSDAQNTTIANHWKYFGGGLRLGVTGDWYWGSNIYLSGIANFGAYMGSYENRAKQTVSNLALPVRNSYFSDARPALTGQFALGPSWQQNFGQYRVELFTGYELNIWMNLQEIRRSSSGTTAPLLSDAKETWINNGAIALYGLTTRLTVDF